MNTNTIAGPQHGPSRHRAGRSAASRSAHIFTGAQSPEAGKKTHPAAKGDEPAASAQASCPHDAGAVTVQPWCSGRPNLFTSSGERRGKQTRSRQNNREAESAPLRRVSCCDRLHSTRAGVAPRLARNPRPRAENPSAPPARARAPRRLHGGSRVPIPGFGRVRRPPWAFPPKLGRARKCVWPLFCEGVI